MHRTMITAGTSIDRERRELRQIERMRAHLHDLHARSPFYRSLFTANGIAPEELRSPADVAALPFTTRSQVEEHHARFIAADRSLFRDTATTSGTTGAPLIVPLTENDLRRLATNEAGSLRIAGVTAADVVQLTTTIDKRFMAGLAYQLGVRALGANLVRMGPGDASAQWDAIARFGTTVLIAVPSFILRMIDHASANGIDPNANRVRRIVCIGEAITDAALAPNALARAINERWKAQLFSTYASTESATASTERAPCSGAVVQDNLLHVEVIDAAGKPLPSGVPGELVVTPFGIEGLPLLRYRSGDVCALHDADGPDGPELRLGPVLGRIGQRLKFKGTSLFPDAIIDAVSSIAPSIAFAVVATTDPIGNDAIAVLIDAPPDRITAITAGLSGLLHVAPEVRIAGRAAIDTLVQPPGARKAGRFIDQRQHQHP